jgi:hypothetical protein
MGKESKSGTGIWRLRSAFERLYELDMRRAENDFTVMALEYGHSQNYKMRWCRTDSSVR